MAMNIKIVINLEGQPFLVKMSFLVCTNSMILKYVKIVNTDFYCPIFIKKANSALCLPLRTTKECIEPASQKREKEDRR